MAKITKEMMQAILQNVGGSENIRHAGNCMTRLRLTLNNDQLVDKTAIK
ncbi:PTS transporter subunit EIIB, partial [Escherichia coli]